MALIKDFVIATKPSEQSILLINEQWRSVEAVIKQCISGAQRTAGKYVHSLGPAALSTRRTASGVSTL